MKKLLSSTIATLLFTLFAVSSLRAADHIWMGGKVVESGYTRGLRGDRIPTVTVEMLDPENSNPNLRRITLIVTAAPATNARNIDLTVGMEFQAYRIGTGYGGLMVQVQDQKGHTKTELHLVAGEL